MREGFLPQAPVLPDITTFEPDAAQRESQGMVLGFPCQVSFSANGCFLSTTCFKLLFTIQCFLHFFLVEISLNFQGGQPSWSEAGITGQSFVIGGKTLLPAGPNATTASCPDFSKHFFVSV